MKFASLSRAAALARESLTSAGWAIQQKAFSRSDAETLERIGML